MLILADAKTGLRSAGGDRGDVLRGILEKKLAQHDRQVDSLAEQAGRRAALGKPAADWELATLMGRTIGWPTTEGGSS